MDPNIKHGTPWPKTNNIEYAWICNIFQLGLQILNCRHKVVPGIKKKRRSKSRECSLNWELSFSRATAQYILHILFSSTPLSLICNFTFFIKIILLIYHVYAIFLYKQRSIIWKYYLIFLTNIYIYLLKRF